jgi:penicillin-binding protein A
MRTVQLTDASAAAVLWVVAAVVALCLIWSMRRVHRSINGQISVIAASIAAVFLVLGVQAARYQILQQDEIVDRSGLDPVSAEVVSNPRLNQRDIERPRGSILARDGTEIAWSIPADSGYRRVYADAWLSSVVGYFSPLLYGKSGLEDSYDHELRGEKGRSTMRQIQGALGLASAGPLNATLTIDPFVQELAQSLLGEKVGAAIVIDVRTGAIIALAGRPLLDPSQVTASGPEQVENAREYWQALLADESKPLVRRSTEGLYPPGSTFKLITAAAAIESGIATPETLYTDDGVLDVGGHVILEANRPDDSVSDWTLAEGFAYSLNVVFAQVGLEVGADALADYTRRFGIGERIPFDIPVAAGQLMSSPDFLNSPAALADTAFGQGELLVTPLHMALVAAAIANNGRMMKPYLVQNLSESSGEVVKETSPEIWKTPVSPDTADQLQEMMVDSVDYGYASSAALAGVRVGGKTGTAESGTDQPHGWFIGFAGIDEPQFAVAVVLEHGGSGGGAPSEIGSQLLSAALQAGVGSPENE